MPHFTVTLGSNRPGGIDIALAGLVNQTYGDFEVIFVDGLYHERHLQVLDFVKKSGLRQPFFHVPNHRFNTSDLWGTTCAGYNTGFALSSGDFVVMLLDYGYAPPMWLELHARHQAQAKIILAPHEYRTLVNLNTVDGGGEALVTFDRQYVDARDYNDVIKAILAQRRRFDSISSFSKPFVPSDLENFVVEESDAKCKIPTQSWEDTNYFNTKNESFPLDAVLAVNGMDENYDRGRGPGDPDLCYRMRLKTHLPMWIVNEAIVHCLNPRGVLPNMNVIIPENRRLPPPLDYRWYIQDGYRHYDRTKQSGAFRAPNPFEINALRSDIWHWRDLSQDPNPVIPKRQVSDDRYYLYGHEVSSDA